MRSSEHLTLTTGTTLGAVSKKKHRSSHLIALSVFYACYSVKSLDPSSRSLRLLLLFYFLVVYYTQRPQAPSLGEQDICGNHIQKLTLPSLVLLNFGPRSTAVPVFVYINLHQLQAFCLRSDTINRRTCLLDRHTPSSSFLNKNQRRSTAAPVFV
jgi:predicted acyltransferase